MRRWGAVAWSAGLTAALVLPAQASPAYDPARDPVHQHMAAAVSAAGLDYTGLVARICLVPQAGLDAAARLAAQQARAGQPQAPRTSSPPPRSSWYQPPQQVFDNLFFVGTSEHNAWLLKTSEGLILIDTLYEWAVRPAIIEGAQKLGLDPKDIKYVVIAHGHGDHNEGAKILQDIGARIVMSAADWDITLNGRPMPGGNPKRDIEAVDGQAITLGDTTLKIYITPGHTPGTISFIFPVKDKGQTRVVAYPGGTAFNFQLSPERLQAYADTQRRFAKLAADAGATVLLSNHSQFDDAWRKARIIKTLEPGEANPFLVPNGVQRYLTVMAECSEAQRARLEQDLAAGR